MCRRFAAGWATIAVYLTAVVLCPALHLAHHADAEPGHTHDGGGHRHTATPAEPSDVLALLGLEDAGAPAAVDCSLAALTLADCETPSDGTRHFGDDVRARPPAATPDLRHGAGSLEHLGLSLLAGSYYLLPPPRSRETRLPLLPTPSPPPHAPTPPHHSRGPPSVAV